MEPPDETAREVTKIMNANSFHRDGSASARHAQARCEGRVHPEGRGRDGAVASGAGDADYRPRGVPVRRV
jgi:hypothetical protein